MRDYRERFYRSGALRIHFRDWGQLENPPLVLVHGLRDHSHSFDDLSRELSRDYRVYAIDLRGHGDSESTPYYAFGHFVGDIRNMIRALRLERPVVVGHSLGGEIVGQWAGTFPDVARAVVIIEGIGPPPLSIPWRLQRHRMVWRAIDRAQNGLPGLPDLEAAFARLRKRNPRLSEAKARELTELGTRAREDGTLEWKFDPMLVTLGVAGGFRLEWMLHCWSQITAPTLLVQGSESGEFWNDKPGAIYLKPEELATRVNAFPNAKYVEIPQAGHMIHFDQPELLLGEIRNFLGELPLWEPAAAATSS
jgi:pimeloyl-ACP methyl ester carboxylesterase